MATLKVPTSNLSLDQASTFLSADAPSGSLSLTVKNITGFGLDQIVIIGDFGNEGSEILKTSHSTAPSGSTLTLFSTTAFPHSSSTPVYVIPYDQLEISTATTLTGAKTILNNGALMNIVADNVTTNYADILNSTGYYFIRFYNSITGIYTSYSAAIPAGGYTILTARAVIDAALGEINKSTSEVLSDAFAFIQLDMCQTEVLRELKRWSFMQKYGTAIGRLSTGSWKVAAPTDMDDQNTNRSMNALRIGTQGRLTWVDKAKFDEMLVGVAYTTLLNAASVGDSTLTLANSADFTATGTVTIGAYTYTYTANNTTTGVLTLAAVIPALEGQAAGADVFQGATTGLPAWWTIYGGEIYYWPLAGSTYNGRNIYGDYYIAQVRITTDSTALVIPDPTIAVNYLCWKFLKKLNNGEDTAASIVYMQKFEQRKTLLKNKETLGKTFRLKPRVQNFGIQMEFDNGDTRSTRTGNFDNTGL